MAKLTSASAAATARDSRSVVLGRTITHNVALAFMNFARICRSSVRLVCASVFVRVLCMCIMHTMCFTLWTSERLIYSRLFVHSVRAWLDTHLRVLSARARARRHKFGGKVKQT